MQNLSNTYFVKHKAKAHRTLIFNGVLWVLAFVVMLFIFSKGKTPIRADYLYTAAFLILIAIPVSLNFYYLIPIFLKKERYLSYGLLFLATLSGSAFLKGLLFHDVLDTLFPSYFFISYLSPLNIFLTYCIFLLVTTLLKLAEDWLRFNKAQNRMLRLQNQHIKTQLSALRSQINPHFLFNSLNVLYAMALEKKETMATAIVNLSDILRYVIYDSDTERVFLKDELQLLNNYIAFQNYRTNRYEAVKITSSIQDENYQIYPMLLLPLLENAFKYGILGSKNNRPIEVDIVQNANGFEFSIKNSKVAQDLGLDKNYSGVGLKTLKENLNLVYPNMHAFEIKSTKNEFEVSLKIYNV